MRAIERGEIKKIRLSMNKTQFEFAEMFGVSPRTVQNWESGNRKITPSTAMLVKKVYKEYEIRNKNTNLDREQSSSNSSNGLLLDNNSNIIHVPLVHQYAYAGYIGGFADSEYIEDLPKIPFIVDHANYKGNYLAFEVRGDSMDNNTSESYSFGDKVLGRKIEQHHWNNKLHINQWDFIIVHQTDGILIKRIIDHNLESGEITLHSLNEMYEDFTINLSEVVQIFNIVQHLKNRKR